MSPDPIRDIADALLDMKRRLHALETAPRVNNTAMLNDDGTARTLDITNGVMRAPIFTATWQRDLNRPIDANGRPLISSGTYTAAWQTIVYLNAGRITTSVFLNLGTGVSSADARITALLAGVIHPDGAFINIGGGEQTVVEWTGITSSQNLDTSAQPWAVPDSIRSPAASPIGAVVRLTLEGRVTGGTGDIWLRPSTLLVSPLVS